MSADRIGLFSQACGVTMPLEIEVEGPGRSERRVLDRPFALLGRDPRADVLLDHVQVGRRHAYLQAITGRVLCVDLASRTGIRRERDDRPSRSAWLGRGEVICIGPFRIRLQSDPGREGDESRWGGADPLASDPDEDRLPITWLEFPGRAVSYPPWRMDRVLALVGRATACKLRLSGPEVSRVHGALVRTPAGLWIVDLLGRGGVVVGGRPVRCSRLNDGDELQIGGHRIRLRHGPLADVAVRGASLLPAIGAAPAGLLPAGGDPGRALAGSGSAVRVESQMLPLIEQFGQMQQQMFDQFQQALVMMFQMFGTLHREQMDLVRSELDQIRRLTQDLQSLQATSDRLEAAPPPPTADAPSPGAGPPPTPSGGHHAGRDQVPPRTGARLDAHSAEDAHALLARKIAEIQSERDNRWKRILGMVLSTQVRRETP